MRWCVLMLACVLVGCEPFDSWLAPSEFALEVAPTAVGDGLPGQRCVLLATVTNDGEGLWAQIPVEITASAPGATVTVENGSIRPGEVAEVTVISESSAGETNPDGGWDFVATIRATRGSLQRVAEVPITVTSNESDLVGPDATAVRDLFIPWLAENRPDLGITDQTDWTGTIVTPHILVVTHYLFYSAEWEMHVFWHVMIPPYDWGRIELRRRFEEVLPSVAFEIPSRSAAPIEVREIEPEGQLWR